MSAIIDALVNGLQNFFGNEYLTVFFISMVPMVEVRGAIPIAISLGIEPFTAYVFSVASALVVCPILILSLKPILNALKKTKLFHKIANFVEENFKSKARGIEEKAEQEEAKIEEVAKSRFDKKSFQKALGLYMFVAIPLPMTGVWTGSAIAAFINLRYRYSVPAIVLGNFTAAGIIALLSYILGDKSFIILIVLAVFILITISIILITALKKRGKNKPNR